MCAGSDRLAASRSHGTGNDSRRVGLRSLPSAKCAPSLPAAGSACFDLASGNPVCRASFRARRHGARRALRPCQRRQGAVHALDAPAARRWKQDRLFLRRLTAPLALGEKSRSGDVEDTCTSCRGKWRLRRPCRYRRQLDQIFARAARPRLWCRHRTGICTPEHAGSCGEPGLRIERKIGHWWTVPSTLCSSVLRFLS